MKSIIENLSSFASTKNRKKCQSILAAAYISSRKIIGSPKINFRGTHVESSIMNNIPRRKKYDMIVIRFLRDGSLACSKPCFHCCKKLRLSSIRFIYYIDKQNFLRREKASLIENDHISSGMIDN